MITVVAINHSSIITSVGLKVIVFKYSLVVTTEYFLRSHNEPVKLL